MSRNSRRGSVSAPSADRGSSSRPARPPDRRRPEKLSTLPYQPSPSAAVNTLWTSRGQHPRDTGHTQTTRQSSTACRHDPVGHTQVIHSRLRPRGPPTSTGAAASPSSTPPTISTEISSKVFLQEQAPGEHPRRTCPGPALRPRRPRPNSFQDVAEGSTVGDRSARGGAESSMKGHEGHTWTRR